MSQDTSNRKLQIAQSFIREILGRAEAIENVNEVVDFLIIESGRFADSISTRKRLHADRQSLSTELEMEVAALQRVLCACGIDTEKDEFRFLTAASWFANTTLPPSILSLALTYVQDLEDLQHTAALHESLLERLARLLETAEELSHSRRVVSPDTLIRLTEDAAALFDATKTIQEQANCDHWHGPAARTPSLDIAYVVRERLEFSELQNALADREMLLQDIQTLPNSLDEVLLVNDRMQRHLQKLTQQRSDLYRSIR